MADRNFTPVESVTVAANSLTTPVVKNFAGSQSESLTPDVLVTNAGTVTAWVVFGPTSAQATAACTSADGTQAIPVLVNETMVLRKGINSFVAALGSGNVYFTSGQGN